MPEDLGEDPQEAVAREKALVTVRLLLANRWLELDRVFVKWSRRQVEDFIARYKAFVEELSVIYGDSIPFPPTPSELYLESMLVDIDKLKKSEDADRQRSPTKSTTASSSGSCSMVSHEFRFLVNAKSVWTVLKVP